jgi:hypothetical protein
MFGRLLRGLFALILYFALATLIAEGIMGWYVASRWQLDGDKMAQMLAVAQGVEINRAPPPAPREPASTSADQPSYDQILEARAMKDKNLQLREQALANTHAQLRVEQRKLTDEEKRYQQQMSDYLAKLDATSKGAKAQGREEVRRILETLKPKQSKEMLLGMLENKETEEVVMLLGGMTDTRRAKILGEFKTPEENKKIEEVLRLIRQGVPEAPVAEKAKQQAQPPSPPASP